MATIVIAAALISAGTFYIRNKMIIDEAETNIKIQSAVYARSLDLRVGKRIDEKRSIALESAATIANQ